MSRKEALSQFIQQIHGRPVVVKLNSGVDYRGERKWLSTCMKSCVLQLVVMLSIYKIEEFLTL